MKLIYKIFTVKKTNTVLSKLGLSEIWKFTDENVIFDYEHLLYEM